MRPAVSRGRWRLTFITWSLVLGVWAMLTVTLGRESLMFIQRLAGHQQTAVALTVALVIVVPVLADAIRNAPRYRRRWRSKRGDWTSRVPSTTPRRFRCASGPAKLTWRESAVVEQGQLAYGRVERHGDLFSVRYDAPWGESIASLPVAVKGSAPREGARAPFLFEPGARMGVAPSLLDLELLAVEARDDRPAALAAARGEARAALAVPVLSTLHPLERSGSANVGELTLEHGKLTLCLAKADPVIARLDQPFRVEVSTHLRSDGAAEVNVLVEPRASSAYRAGKHVPLRFKTELPQRAVARHLPREWVDAGYVSSEDFASLWQAILHAADDSALGAAIAVTR